jgi:hypothetical protein
MRLSIGVDFELTCIGRGPLPDARREKPYQAPCVWDRVSRLSTIDSPAERAAEWPVTADRKSSRRRAYSLESTAAVTVAVRGTS